MDPCLLFLLNDSEFEAIQRNLEKEKSNQQNGIGTGPAASSADEEASALLEDILKDQDWRSLEPLLLDTFAKDPLAQTSRTIAMLALSKAHRRRNPEQAMKLAKEAYEMCSTEGIAYVAMAQARLSTQQVFEAQKWINLASSSNANGNFWFDTTQALVEQAVASRTALLKRLVLVLKEEDRIDLLKRHYELTEENLALLRKLELGSSLLPETLRLLESCERLLRFLYNLSRDPCPVLFQPSPPAPVTGSDFCKLAPTLASRIGTFLSLADHSRLRTSCPSLNTFFGSPVFWKGTVDRAAFGVDKINGPIAPYEWEFIYRSYVFVLRSLKLVSMRFGPGLIFGGPPFVLTQEERQQLWILAARHRIAPRVPIHCPLALIFSTAHDLLILDGETPSRFTKCFTSLGLYAIASTSLFEQPNETATLKGALSLLSAFIKSSDGISVVPKYEDIFKAHLISGVRNLIFTQSYAPYAFSALNTLLLSPLVDPKLRLLPVSPSPLTASAIRQTQLPMIETEQNGASKASALEPELGGLTCKRDASGVYRIYFHYSHPELDTQRDEGVLQLRVDGDSGRLSGRGIDTLRGPFLVFEARGRKKIQEDEQIRRQKQKDRALNRKIQLVLQYSDGVRLGLSGSLFSYGYTGVLEFLPSNASTGSNPEEAANEAEDSPEEDLEENGVALQGLKTVQAVMGGWMMLYDHDTTHSMPSRWDELWKLTEEKENAKIVNERNGQRLEPWSHQDESPDRVRAIETVRLLSSQLQAVMSPAATYSQVISLAALIRRPLDPSAAERFRSFIDNFSGKLPTESDRKFLLRMTLVLSIAVLIGARRTVLALTYHTQRLSNASHFLADTNHENYSSENGFWIEALAVSPFETPVYAETIKTLYNQIVAPAEAKQSISATQDTAVRALRDSLKGKRETRHATSTTLGPAIYVTAIASATFLSTAAYFAYKYFFRRKRSQ